MVFKKYFWKFHTLHSLFYSIYMKCPCKTHFNIQCPPPPNFWTFRQSCFVIIVFFRSEYIFHVNADFSPPGYLIWARFCTGLTRFTKKRIAIFCEEINWWKKERWVAAFLALDWSFYLLFSNFSCMFLNPPKNFQFEF